jgi:hypothetical protein
LLITVTNGREAYISTGDEFSYIASIKSATDAQGQITTTSDIQRMSVGVMTVGVMSVGEITVGVMTVGVMRRPRVIEIFQGGIQFTI